MGNPRGVPRDFDALERRRFEAIRLIEQGLSHSETARRLQVARQTVSEWVRQFREQGPEGLRQAGRAGRKPLLSRQQRDELQQLLLAGPEANGFSAPTWTCPRVGALIRERFGVDYHEGHVWKLLQSLNWIQERPIGKARDSHETAILNEETWLAGRKEPSEESERSSSSKRADST